MRIVLTHSEGRFEGLEAALSRRGHEVHHQPLIRTRPRSGPEARAEAEALLALPWLMFTSRSAVEAWQGLGAPWASPDLPPDDARPLIAAVGRNTASALRRAGAEVALVGERSQADSLADAFLAEPRAAGPVGLPQGDRALPTLRRALEGAGFETRPLVLYETVTEPFPEAMLTGGASDAEPAAPLVVLASPSAAGALPSEVARSATLVAIGPTTAAAVEERGFPCLQAASPNVAGVLATVDAVAGGGEPAGGPAAGGGRAGTDRGGQA